MWQDAIVEEVRAIRDEHARTYHYDLRAIFEALKEEERRSDRKIVRLQPKRKTRQKLSSVEIAH